MNPMSRKSNSGSTHNSGEQVTTVPAVSEVDEGQIAGQLASPLPTQVKEASATPARIYHSIGETSMFSRHNVRARRDPWRPIDTNGSQAETRKHS